jgi:hypothetical protein
VGGAAVGGVLLAIWIQHYYIIASR